MGQPDGPAGWRFLALDDRGEAQSDQDQPPSAVEPGSRCDVLAVQYQLRAGRARLDGMDGSGKS